MAGIRTLSELRAWAGPEWADASDEDVMSMYARAAKVDPLTVANALSYDMGTGSLAGERTSASVDSYQSSLYDTASHASRALGLTRAADWLDERRRSNRFQADVAQGRARALGGIDSFFDQKDAQGNVVAPGVGGVGDFFTNYLPGMAIQSAPYLAEAAAGGLLGRAAMTGAKTAYSVGRELGMPASVEAARTSLRYGSTAGAVAASYPSAVGDILNNQREEAGTTDPSTAAALGVPYAALNAFGLEGAAARGTAFRNGVAALDSVQGWRGGLARAGATAVGTGFQEGLSETGQEFINQAGRNAVNPNAGYFGPEALDRYKESFVGGAALGGVFGGAGGGWRRSGQYQPAPTVDPAPGEQTDLLQISKGFDARAPLADFTPAGPRPGSRVLQMPPESMAGEPEWGLSQGARDPVDAMPAVGEAADLFRMPMDGRFPVAGGYDPRLAGLFTGPVQPGQTLGDRFTTPLTVPDMPAVGTPVTADPLGVNVQGEYGDMFNRAQTADPDQLRGALTPAEDPGLALARQRYEEQIRAAEAKREQQAAIQAAIQAAAEKFAAKRTAATEALIEPNADGSLPIKLKEREITTHSKLAELRDAGAITPEQYAEYAGRMREALKRNDRQVLGRVAKEVAELEKARVTSPGATGGTGAADLGRGAADQRAPGQPGGVRPTGAQPAAEVVAGERSDGVRPGVAGGGDALTGPNLAGKFVERVQQLDPESQAYLSRWLGVEMDGDGRLTLREDGAESLRTMADTLGVSHETVRERVRKALRQMGLPETVQAQELYEDLGLSAAGTDIDTVNRMTQGEPESEPATDALDAVEEVADDTALGGVGDTQVRATPAARRGPARVGDDQDAPLLTERPDDDPAGRVREAVGPIDEGSLAAEDRIDEARGLTLDDALETDVSTGRVVADDIDEARYFYEQNRQRGMQPWNRQSVIDQATAVRLYARARLAGDPLVLATKKALYEDAQRTDGRRGSAADAGAARDATGGAAESGNTAADAGDAGDQPAQRQVPAAGGPVPVVTKRKRRTVRAEPDEDVTWGDQLASAEQGGVALDRSRTQATTREQVLAQAPFGKAAAALRALGLGHVLDWVGEWRTADSDPNVAEGWLEGVGVRYALTLKPADAFRTSVEAEWTFAHELGHAADLAVSGGVYSAHPALAFDIDGDQAVGRGAVAAELAELYENDPFWSSVLAYPLDVRYYGTGDGEVVSAEVFAQLFAMYVSPKGRAKLRLDAPLAFQFIQESVNDIQASRPLAARTPGEVKGRAQAFARRYRGVSSAQSGGASQGSRGGSDAGDRSSARSDVGPRLSKSNPAAAEVAKLEDARKAIRDRMPPPAQDALTSIGDAFRKYSPYLLSSFQLMEQFGDKIKSLAKHLKITDLMVQESTRQQMAYDAIAKRWEGLPTVARELLNTVARTATLRGMHPDRAFDAEGNKHLKPEARAEYDRLRAEYQRMERTFPAAAQVYQDALKQLEASWDAQEKAIAQLYEKYGVKRPELKKVPGPYFPLMRFGEYLATAKSAEFMELEDQLRMTDDPTTRAEAMKILAEMKRDPKHYVVSAHETRAAQERALRKLQEQGSFQEVRAGMASQRLESMPRDIHATITDLTAAMGKHFDPDSVKMIEQSLSQMLLRTLPEAHALERQAQRAGVEGATTDMLRAFAAAGRQNAFYTARTLHAKDLATNMEAMKGEVKGNVDLMHVHREIEKRVALDLQFKDTPIQNWLSTVSWIYNLGVSPTFLAMNALQPALVTFPTLAAKYGAGTASRELSRAWKEALQVLKDARFKDGKWDAWAGINEQSVRTTRKNAEGVSEDRKALRELMQRGIVDEGLVHDMGRLADGQTGMVERVAKYTGWASQQIELANRVSTALATFRLARGRGLEYDAAVEEAYRSTVKTQIDYSAEGAPRFMREGGGIPLAKLIFQFRRYQQGMLYLLGSNIQKAFGRGAEASEARAVLGYFAVVSGLAAGALGMPLAGAVMWALNAMFPDDDEEGDAETRFRNLLFDLTGDQKMATVLAKGLPALWGMDLSARIGMGDVAAPLPRLEMAGAKTAEDKIGRLLTNIAGPVAGLGVRAYDAATYWSQGDMLKGTERALPKAAGDVIQSYRLATQGMTDRKGEQILGADELDAWDKLYRGLGTTPTVQSNYYEATGARRQVEQAINDRKSRIRVEFRNALRDGDMSDVRELIDDFNRDHPDAKIKPKDEMAWRREASKAEAQRGPDGIKVNPKRDQRYEELMRFARG